MVDLWLPYRNGMGGGVGSLLGSVLSRPTL